MSDASSLDWNVLIVDDEDDVHSVTKLALRNKKWRGRKVKLTSAKSGKEAREMLAAGARFQCAVVDVVMESDHAGLDLCEWMRENQPRSIRIILRTGQPGMAPEDEVLNRYDIDHYLSKSEMTAENLYRAIRSCLRVSQDVETLCTVRDQLKGLAVQFLENNPDGMLPSLVKCMQPVADLMALKYGARVVFFANSTSKDGTVIASAGVDAAQIATCRQALKEAQKKSAADLELHAIGSEHVLPFRNVDKPAKKDGALKKLARLFGAKGESDEERGGLVVFFSEAAAKETGGMPDFVKKELEADARLFLENWKLAYRMMLMEEAVTDHMGAMPGVM